MGWFRALLIFDALAMLVLAFFFVDGLRYAPSGDYFSAWLPILAIPLAGLWLAWMLKANEKTGAAIAVLALLAAPGLLYLLVITLILVLQPNWQ